MTVRTFFAINGNALRHEERTAATATLAVYVSEAS